MVTLGIAPGNRCVGCKPRPLTRLPPAAPPPTRKYTGCEMLNGVMLLWFVLMGISLLFVAVDIRTTLESPVLKWGLCF
jgi:hypothetical protein